MHLSYLASTPAYSPTPKSRLTNLLCMACWLIMITT